MKETVIENGMKFEVPDHQLYCEKCGTTNFFYYDNKPPYYCDNCKSPLDSEKDKLTVK
ncbi:MAG: hypothetical protein FWG66_09910 [Spirochaetes bacterium]|nr:hypothetical protein [Spirochaetota bacterium]